MYRHRQFFAFSIYFCVSTIAFTLRHNQVEFLCVPLDGLWWLIHRSIKLDHLVANDQHFPGDTVCLDGLWWLIHQSIKLDHIQVANDQHFPGDSVRLPSKRNNFQLNALLFHFDEHHRRPGNGWRTRHCLTVNMQWTVIFTTKIWPNSIFSRISTQSVCLLHLCLTWNQIWAAPSWRWPTSGYFGKSSQNKWFQPQMPQPLAPYPMQPTVLAPKPMCPAFSASSPTWAPLWTRQGTTQALRKKKNR